MDKMEKIIHAQILYSNASTPDTFIYLFIYLFIYYVLCLCTLETEAECLKIKDSVAWHNDKTRNFNMS